MDADECDVGATEVEKQFLHFRTEIESEQQRREDIRAVTRELERLGRDFVAAMEKTHPLPSASGQPPAPADGRLRAVCAKVRRQFVDDVRPLYAKLAALAPVDEYYRYHDQFRWVTQRLAFAASLLIYLDTEQLADRQQVADLLVLPARGDGLHLDLEDYLHGLLQLASELARYSVNSVAAGDYGRPVKIHQFVTELDAGFRLLNLKNDSLRKRFDVLKYDVQKVENVVYDLTIRGLKPPPVEEHA